MSKKWSKLQKEYYLLRASGVNLQLHSSIYRMQSNMGSTDIPRYWITLEKEIIWDYPNNFIDKPHPSRSDWFPYCTDISAISCLIRQYIDTPKDQLFHKIFENDFWGLTNILKASDKRIGSRRLDKLQRKVKNKAALKVIEHRIFNLKNGVG